MNKLQIRTKEHVRHRQICMTTFAGVAMISSISPISTLHPTSVTVKWTPYTLYSKGKTLCRYSTL